MTQNIKSEGKCIFCGKTYKKAGINRHLQKHLEEKTLQGRPGKSFLLKVEMDKSWGSGPYFLSLWMDGGTKMEQLDVFLRNIWLECCGHMSSFTNPKKKAQSSGMWDFFEAEELLEKGKVKEYEALMESKNGEVPMGRKVKDALHKDLILNYQYDFGSTTALQVSVVAEYPVAADDKIILLSRNESLEIFCDTCGKMPAKELCSVCLGYEDEGFFCAKCAKKHAKTCEDFADYAAMPVVNSPRMGVCAYDGGTIDKKRDGVLNPEK